MTSALALRSVITLLLALAPICESALADPPRAMDEEPASKVDFNREIRPILSGRCGTCHGGVHRRGGLSFLFRDDALRAGDSGQAAIVPHAPEKSYLLDRVTSTDDPMPPTGERLSDREVQVLRRWIQDGARYEDHWAYVPPDPSLAPPSNEGTFARTGIDRFVLADLHAKGMVPSEEASREEWLRRVSLDLTGLPPSLEEQDAFLSDQDLGAYERQVDRLLGSQHFGERFAAMWLDLARYADTKGYEKDGDRTIWPYRDWVIAAFNADLPFDQFTVAQLAGDLLPDPSPETILATAFHRNTMNNDEGGTDDEEFRVAAIIDRVNTTYDVWMGTTMGCAQCHNHPYEPFTQHDYYRSFAVFNQTEDADRPDETPALEIAPDLAGRARIARLDADIAALLERSESLEARWTAPEFERDPAAVLAATSTGGTSLSVVDHRELMAGGMHPTTSECVIDLDPPTTAATALRLDVTPDPAFPAGGVGRGKDGNFVLSDITVSVVDPNAVASHLARYVRLELPGTDRILHLAEVQVLGPDGQNHATEGRATQSSTDYGAKAERAIDGRTDGDFASGSVTHTRTDSDPWWEVDLGRARPVARVVLWNRTDGDAQIRARMRGVRVSLRDEAGRSIWQQTLPSAPEPASIVSLDPRERMVPFFHATHSFAQSGFGVSQTLWNDDLDRRGWAVAPRQSAAHHAIFRLLTPAEVPPGGFVRVRLAHWYTNGGQYAGAALGRFSLSLSGDPGWLPPGAPGEFIANERATRRVRAERDGINTVAVPILRERPADMQRTTRVLVRGNFLDPGEAVTADLPRSLGRDRGEAPVEDRLQFARWLVSPDNPLTARVIVNRFWEQLFGLGLVETLEDFGTQGEPPAHPALLDWLAVRFRCDLGWSVKSLLIEIVLSATYRQDHRRAGQDVDPRNRDLARGPRNRLTAEQIRDHALAASGLLSKKMFGPGVMPPQPDGIWQTVYNGSQWTTPEGEDRYRRALYTFWRRTAPYPSMVMFDAPSREFCVSRRISTNTPLQALVVMNDPVYVECAAALARRMYAAAERDDSRIIDGFRRATGRVPDAVEVDTIQALLADARRDFEERPGDVAKFGDDVEHAAWSVVASVLLNLDEALTR